MNRRTFFSTGITGTISALAARMGFSSSDVPRSVDCRLGHSQLDIDVYRYGVKINDAGVVAYDLDADWVDVLLRDPQGRVQVVNDQIATERLFGGVAVRWQSA